MLMRSRRALRSRREWLEGFEIEAGDASIDFLSAARRLPSHEGVLLRGQQDNDDSDGGVIVDYEKSKTYVGPDIAKVDGKKGRESV
jgi:hypothetical protein